MHNDISEIDKTKEEISFIISILSVLNRYDKKIDLIKELLFSIKEFSECDSIGIRLKDENEDFPYYFHDGFSDDFIKLENKLCCIKDDINYMHNCFCSMVLKYTDCNKYSDFFTDNCSFWCDDLDLFKKNYLKNNELERGTCMKYGYKSIAIISLRFNNNIIGTLQLNYFEKNKIDLDFVMFMENIGESICIALDRKNRMEEVISSQKALKEMMDELRYKNEELEQFAYISSHDLQEPLRVISLYCQLVENKLKDDIDDETKKYFSYIQDSTKRMRTLIKELLDFSRIGQKDSIFENINLNDILSEVCFDLKLNIEETKTIIISPTDLPEVLGIRIRLKQLFYNLIGNSIKFRSDKIPLIYISFCEDKKYWTFSVKDNGIGIDPKFFDRIFGVFKRLYSREEYPGNGIGLALCQKIVETHGGRIWVESSVGEGTIFYFTLSKSIEF